MTRILDGIARRYIDRLDITAERVPIPRELRHDVLRRDGRICRYCGVDCRGYYELDHVWPVSKGGPTVLENLVISCKDCNRQKSAHIGIWPLPPGFFSKSLTAWRRWLLWIVLRS